MGFDPVSGNMVLGGLLGGYMQSQADAAKAAQAQAQAQATKAAAAQADQVDQNNNRINAKKPDVAGMLLVNQQAGKAGIGGTMLTGAGGVSDALSLGKNTLLGG